jgi:hypothetical protein
VTAADLQAHVTYTQADTHSTNSYRIVLYAADNLTQLNATAWQVLGPPIVSGGNFDTIDWTSGTLVDAGTYYIAVQTADAVTGVISESGHRQLLVAFTPPSPASGLTATSDPDAGTVTLSWTNPGGTTSTLVEWQPHTETGVALGWRQLGASGQLWNHVITPNQAPQLKADYRVTIVNSLGLKSSTLAVNGVYLDNALDYAGIWINDVNDVLNRKCYFGMVDNWDSLKRDLMWDMEEWTPEGASLPVQTFGLKDYWVLGTSNALKLFLPWADLDTSGGIHYGADNRDMAISLARTHVVLIYRDRRFPVPIYVKFSGYEDQPNEDIFTDMTFELHQTAYFAPLPVVGSLI